MLMNQSGQITTINVINLKLKKKHNKKISEKW